MNLTGSDVRVESMSPDPPKIRAVFDCMVFLQGAARRESAVGACLLLVELDAIEFCVSEEILAEVRDVLARPRVRQRFPALTDQIVDRFLVALEKRAIVVSAVPRIFQFDRDPKDEPYINLAITARVSYLVSRDNDILDLANVATPDGKRLRQQAPELQILDPVAFLGEIRRRLQAPSGD
jgi:putative PIN family toxin of toxin-antitoxin system